MVKKKRPLLKERPFFSYPPPLIENCIYYGGREFTLPPSFYVDRTSVEFYPISRLTMKTRLR